MDSDEIKKYFKDAFHQVAPEIDFGKIKLDLPFRDQIEIDSLDLYNIIVSLQKKTGVYIPDSKIAELKSLNELIGFILNNKDVSKT